MTTEDGYILRLHRIPHGKRSPKKEGERRPAVLVQHGILSSSADWVLAIPEKALGKKTYRVHHVFPVGNC